MPLSTLVAALLPIMNVLIQIRSSVSFTTFFFALNFRRSSSFFSMKRKKSSWDWPFGVGCSSRRVATFCILNDDVKRLCFLLLFMCITGRPATTESSQRHPLNITAVTGITVELKCKVRLHECGNFNG